MQQHVQNAETLAEAAKVAPAITVSGMVLWGYPLSDWLILLTIVYTLVQLVLLIEKRIKQGKQNANSRK